MEKIYSDIKNGFESGGYATFGARCLSSRFKYYKVLFLLLFLTAFVALDAEASHFRHGNISWRVVSGNTVEFKVSQAWRYTSFYGVSMGATINTGSLIFGDGTSAYIPLKVTAINTAEDWFYGEAIITKTYPAGVNAYTAFFSICCRISTLQNNRDQNARIETRVTVGAGNNAPVTTLPALVNLARDNASASFNVPVAEPDGDPVNFRLATSAEMGGGNNTNPSGLTVDSNTGVVTFNTTGKVAGQLYSAAIAITDDRGAKTIVDFIIKITQQSTPPVFDFAETPTNGTVYQVSPGQAVNFNIKAADSDPGDNVLLQAVGLPSGSSLSPALPLSGNPVQSAFSWTPSSSNLGTNVISFIAQDNQGVQTTISVSILVSLKPVFDVPPTPPANQHAIYAPGQSISYTVQASDPDPDDVVKIIKVEGKDANGNKIPLYAGASFSALPTAAGNPTSGTFSWTPQGSDWGHKHIFITAEDSYGDRTVHEISQLINSTPLFVSSPVVTADVGQLYEYQIEATDDDLPYGDQLAIKSSMQLPAWLTLTDNGDGTATLTGTPGTEDVGTITVSLQAEDINHHSNIGGMPEQSFDITVNNCVINPVTKDITVQLDADGNAVIEAADVDDNSLATCGIRSLALDISNFDCSNVGENTVTLTVTDVNGNSESATASVIVEDKVAPIAKSKNITVQLSSTGHATIEAADVDDYSTDACGIQSLELDKSSFDCSNLGDNEVLLTVKDLSGNSNFATAVVTVVDEINPTAQAQDITLHLDETGSATITAEEINNNSSDNCTVASLSLDKTTFSCEDLGANTVTLTVEDQSGNQSTATATVTVVDEILPEIIAPGEIRVFNDPGECGAVVSIGDAVATDNCSVSVSNDAPVDNIFPVGTTQVTWTATDAAGNMVTATQFVTVEDTEAPTLEELADITVSNDEGECGAIVSFELPAFGDNCAGASIAQTDGTGFSSGSLFPVGTSTLSYTVTDAAGHQTSVSFEVTVTDNEAPGIEAPVSILQSTDAGECSAVVPLTDPQVTDNCDIASIVNDAPADNVYSVGDHTVNWTITDIHGNIARVSQQVLIRDQEAPVVVTKNHTVRLGADGTAAISVDDIDNGSSDNCIIASRVLDITSFGCSDLGERTVTLKVTDVNGNSNTSTAVVTVVDEIAPSITAPDDITVGNDAGLCIATVNLGDAIASDNCTGVSVTNDAPAEFQVGETIVTWTATDASGNRATATQIVTVTNESPVISSISAPLDPQQIGSVFSVTASFVDNNLSVASWEWGDGTSSPGSIAGSEVSGSHSYSIPGVYTITCTVTDVCEKTSSEVYQYVVAYDPNGGFITGGGWINSPEGAYIDDPAAVGKANFGFVAKYKKGANVPHGNTEFKFKAGNLDFRSTAYEWLVIAGHKAMYKGEGTINGSGGYGFQFSAVDGDIKGSGEPDRIRMKIWDQTGAVVYDNQMNAADDAEAVMALGGGSIVIHDGKTKGKGNARESAENIEMKQSFENFSAYPVPLKNGGLWLEFPALEEGGDFDVSIYDLHGRKMAEKQFKNDQFGGKQQWDLEHQNWPFGMYMLIIKGEGIVHQQKIIK